MIEIGSLPSIDFSQIKKLEVFRTCFSDLRDSADIQILDAKMKEIENW